MSRVTHLAFTFQGISQKRRERGREEGREKEREKGGRKGERERERKKETPGDEALMEQRCFTEFYKSIYTSNLFR